MRSRNNAGLFEWYKDLKWNNFTGFEVVLRLQFLW
jgi:hypothetical protein